MLAGAALAIGSAPAATSSTIEATEGSPFSGQVATASAPCTPVSTPTATITWGDGGQSAAAQITVSGATLAIYGSHTYAEEGSYSGSLSGSYLCDRDQVPFRATFAVQVGDAPLQGSAASLPALVTGSTFGGTVATFTDANPLATAGDYRIGVAWGDGRSSTASVTEHAHTFVVQAAHAYTAPGVYHVLIGIRDRGGAATTVTDTVTVRGAPPPRAHLMRPHSVGDGTAVLSLQLPTRGTLTVAQTGRHLTRHTLYLRPMRARILHPGPLTLVLSPTTLGRGLERRGHRLRLNTLVTFKPAVGGIIRWHIPIVFGYEDCTPGLTFHYTGAEQACVVPHDSEMRIIAVGGRGGNGWPDCGLSLNLGGAGGYGAQVDATRVSVHPGEVLYIEVGGDGGNGTHNCQIGGGAGTSALISGTTAILGVGGAGGTANGGGAGGVSDPGCGQPGDPRRARTAATAGSPSVAPAESTHTPTTTPSRSCSAMAAVAAAVACGAEAAATAATSASATRSVVAAAAAPARASAPPTATSASATANRGCRSPRPADLRAEGQPPPAAATACGSGPEDRHAMPAGTESKRLPAQDQRTRAHLRPVTENHVRQHGLRRPDRGAPDPAGRALYLSSCPQGQSRGPSRKRLGLPLVTGCRD